MNTVDLENSIIEFKKIGTLLQAFSSADELNIEDYDRAIEIIKDLFNQKFKALEKAFYSK